MGRANGMNDHAEPDTTTAGHVTSEPYNMQTTTRESFVFPNIVHDEPPQEDAPADDIAYSDPKFGAKTKSKKGRKVTGTKVSGMSSGADGYADEGSGTYQGCWALDHVIIVNTAHLPGKMEDSFDPVDPGDWLMFPGAQFKVRFLSFLGRLYKS